MKWLFWISLLLINLPATESVQEVGGCLSQPTKVIWRKPGQSVVLPCAVNSNCSGEEWHYGWFSCNENLQICQMLDNSLKFRVKEVSLHISSLHTNDSGIYYCATFSHGHPAPSSQYVGLGTTLIVEEDDKITQRTVLWLSFILLAIYNLTLLTLIVKKYGCMRKTEEKNSGNKKQFQKVLQEMYRRGNLQRTKQTATSTDVTSTFDDIYQNI